MVAPGIARLQEASGVRRIYSAQTVFRRAIELAGSDRALNSTYDLVIVLRLNSAIRRYDTNS